MEFHPLDLSHQKLLEPLWQSQRGISLSEYTFASRYLFRRTDRLQVGKEKDRVWIRGEKKGIGIYLMPTLDLRQIPEKELLQMAREGISFYPIPEEWLSSFSGFQHRAHRDEADYLYAKEKIATYPGRHLSPKRNLVKQFERNYTAEILPLEKKHASEALFILESWQASFEGEKSDFLPCKEGIQSMDLLSLEGFLFLIEGAPAAFLLGEKKGPFFIIHFAKALTQYKGIYPYLFKESALRLPPEIQFLNWEQDLGEKGLRQSKLSYEPDQLAAKYQLLL